VFLLSNKDDQQLTPDQQQQLSATLMQVISEEDL
jgi:[protein-PII] uridylyltransferase